MDHTDDQGNAAEKPGESDDQKLYKKLDQEMKETGKERRAATARRSVPGDEEIFQPDQEVASSQMGQSAAQSSRRGDLPNDEPRVSRISRISRI